MHIYACADLDHIAFETSVPLLDNSGSNSSYHIAVDGKTFAIIREYFPGLIYQRV